MKLKIISDGTNEGTKLIDEDTGEMFHGISKLNWQANTDDTLTKVNVEFFNVPVEIVTQAKIELMDYTEDYTDLQLSKNFDKNIKITSKSHDGKAIPTTSVKVYDMDTNEIIGAVQSIKWEATPKKCEAEIVKIKIDNRN